MSTTAQRRCKRVIGCILLLTWHRRRRLARYGATTGHGSLKHVLKAREWSVFAGYGLLRIHKSELVSEASFRFGVGLVSHLRQVVRSKGFRLVGVSVRSTIAQIQRQNTSRRNVIDVLESKIAGYYKECEPLSIEYQMSSETTDLLRYRADDRAGQDTRRWGHRSFQRSGLFCCP